MTLTVTDLFCGAGGSSIGAESVPGVKLVMAANHWRKAIDTHQANFPDAAHDCADVSQVDFRRYRSSDILLASPECTNHTSAKGISRHAQREDLFDIPDPSAVRSRATMWDVHRYIEIHRPAAVVVENVVEAAAWLYWVPWWSAFEAAGYEAKLLNINSMHVPGRVPQSRDRIYIVAVRRGVQVDLTLRPQAACDRCGNVSAIQVFKRNGRAVGRYRQSYVWRCPSCSLEVRPDIAPASQAIDWSLPIERIGDRKKPLADSTLRRIRIGLERYGITVVQGAGHTFDRASSGYARCWPADGPIPTQTGDIGRGIAAPTAFIEALVTLRNHGEARPLDEPATTVAANGNHHALVQLVETAHSGSDEARVRPIYEPFRTLTASDDRPLVVSPPDSFYVRNFGTNRPREVHVHPLSKPLGAICANDHTALLVPYNGKGAATSTQAPMPTQPTRDRFALLDPRVDIDDCRFRMLEPHEVGRAMAFPDDYRVEGTKKDRVRLYGNAVTPPVMRWIVSRIASALGAA